MYPLLSTGKTHGSRGRTTDFDEAGDYVVPNMLSPKDLVYRPDNMDETVLHTCFGKGVPGSNLVWRAVY